MSLIFYNPTTQCDKCKNFYDDWSDLECPNCRTTVSTRPIQFKLEINIRQKAEYLFQQYIKQYLKIK